MTMAINTQPRPTGSIMNPDAIRQASPASQIRLRLMHDALDSAGEPRCCYRLNR